MSCVEKKALSCCFEHGVIGIEGLQLVLSTQQESHLQSMLVCKVVQFHVDES